MANELIDAQIARLYSQKDLNTKNYNVAQIEIDLEITRLNSLKNESQ